MDVDELHFGWRDRCLLWKSILLLLTFPFFPELWTALKLTILVSKYTIKRHQTHRCHSILGHKKKNIATREERTSSFYRSQNKQTSQEEKRNHPKTFKASKKRPSKHRHWDLLRTARPSPLAPQHTIQRERERGNVIAHESWPVVP